MQQFNEDGSYTFGYENSDGSFRMENRDASGFVVGRYGYIDTNGVTQEIGSIFHYLIIAAAMPFIISFNHSIDYVSGNLGGDSVGHQVRGTLIPRTAMDTPFPVIRRSSSAQSTRENNNVDVSNVGLSDDNSVVIVSRDADANTGNPSVVRIVASGKTTPVYNSPNIDRAIGSSSTSYSTPTVALRLPSAPVYNSPTPVVDVTRIVAPAYSSSSSSSFIRSPNAVSNYGEQQQINNNVVVSRTPLLPTSSYGATGRLDSFLGNLPVAGGRIKNGNSNGYGQQPSPTVVINKLLPNSGSIATSKVISY